MNDLQLNCPACQQPLTVNADSVGQLVACPSCAQAFTVPAPAHPAKLRLSTPSVPTTPPPGDEPDGGFCTACGGKFAPGATFCPSCGTRLGQGRPGIPPKSPPVPEATHALSENVASGLCYLAGWVTGLIFLVVDKRPAVRFHAAQSVVTFGGLTVGTIIFNRLIAMIMVSSITANPGKMPDFTWLRAMSLGHDAFWILTFVLWLVCMVTAFMGSRFEVPVAGSIAESMISKRP